MVVDMARTLLHMEQAALVRWIFPRSLNGPSLLHGTTVSFRTSLGAKTAQQFLVPNSCMPLKLSGRPAPKLDVLPFSVLPARSST
jgi:hypothetical protein